MKSKSVCSRWARCIARTVHRTRNSKTMLKLAIFASVAAVLWGYFSAPVWLCLLAVFALYLASGGWRFTRAVVLTLPRDLRALKRYLTVNLNARRLYKQRSSIPTLWKQTWQAHPEKIACYYQDETMTFREVDEYSNQIANYFHEAGYRHGDVIALFMESRPEYICIWLGLAKIGVITALINFNLREESLSHCIASADAKLIIFGKELTDAVRAVRDKLRPGIKYHSSGGLSDEATSFASCLDAGLATTTKLPAPAFQLPSFTEKLFYIYTSGTTGLPKAAVITHFRFYAMAFGIHQMLDIGGGDTIYACLPLYHTAGGILGAGCMILVGSSIAIRSKFSASRFWDDCIKYRATCAQYIGEICRYLLAQPPKPVDRLHGVKLVFGNGLRPQIWHDFMDRFGIQRVGEFYGATEGNTNIVNSEGVVGAVGFTSVIVPWAYPITLVRVKPGTDEPQRDRDGMCVRSQPGEPGVLVGKISRSDPLRAYDGYVSKAASEKKVIENVFSKGDVAFHSGDVLVMDECGNFFFRDRTGDTFRWRGENVSTAEVEGVVSNIVGLRDAVVYGVEVPGNEGKAGMAGIVDADGTLDLTRFASDVKLKLPAYARPLFLRIMREAEQTGTYKFMKLDLVKVGFDPKKTEDKLFYLEENRDYTNR